MTKRITRLAACIILSAFATTASSEELVAEYQGTGNKTTLVFTVKAPWILDWRINSDYNKMISFDLDLVDGTTNVSRNNSATV